MINLWLEYQRGENWKEGSISNDDCKRNGPKWFVFAFDAFVIYLICLFKIIKPILG